MTQTHELKIGDVIAGRYRITGQVGQGGVGVVYRAEQINLRRTVALKVLLPQYAAETQHRRRFEREARVAATLRHPSAVQIYDVGLDGAAPFIAMEFLRGCELRELMPEGEPRPLTEVLTVARTMADVLAAAHGIPLIHRDIKPENIFALGGVIDEGSLRVVDFGLAFIAGVDELGRMTQGGQVVGTPAYLSPEQASGLPLGPASDVYSLGCVLYELATGWPPFVGSWMNVMTQHLHVSPTPPRERAPDARIPGDLDALILSMMAKLAIDRPTIGEVRSALVSVSETLSGARHRGRSDVLLASRRERMISVTDGELEPSPLVAADATIVAGFVSGTSDELAIALASNGIGVVPVRPGELVAPHVEVVVVRESGLDVVQRVVELGRPVLAIVGGEELEHISELLRLGVDDVVPQPARVEDVVKKIRRVVHKRRRRNARRSK